MIKQFNGNCPLCGNEETEYVSPDKDYPLNEHWKCNGCNRGFEVMLKRFADYK